MWPAQTSSSSISCLLAVVLPLWGEENGDSGKTCMLCVYNVWCNIRFSLCMYIYRSLANPEDERSFVCVKEDEPPSATVATVSNNAVCFTEQSHGGPGVEVPACGSEREEMTMDMAMKGSVAGEIPTPHASDQQGEPPTESSTNPRSSRGQCSSGGEEPGTKGFRGVMSRGSEPLVPHGSGVGIVQSVEQSTEASGSSLVFYPRGLSRGSLSQVTSTPADMAPDLEMDLYGISYSLDDN